MSIFKSLQLWITASIVLFTIVILLAVRLTMGPPPRGPGPVEKLNLTHEQQEQLNQLLEAHHRDLEAGHKEIKKAEKDFRKLLTQTNSSEEQLKQSFEKIDQMKSNMGRTHFNLTLKIRAIIGAEGLKSFHHLMRPPPPRRGRHHGRKGGDHRRDKKKKEKRF